MSKKEQRERKLSANEAWSCFICPTTPCKAYVKADTRIIDGKPVQLKRPGTYCTCEPWGDKAFNAKEEGL